MNPKLVHEQEKRKCHPRFPLSEEPCFGSSRIIGAFCAIKLAILQRQPRNCFCMRFISHCRKGDSVCCLRTHTFGKFSCIPCKILKFIRWRFVKHEASLFAVKNDSVFEKLDRFDFRHAITLFTLWTICFGRACLKWYAMQLAFFSLQSHTDIGSI
jgi:hypothetical protein